MTATVSPETQVHQTTTTTATTTTTTTSKPTPAKDLINLRNVKNGEVYRFSCRTCIDGHRAPLCDPKKHRGKVMYRRPNPGRPARQCGHPKSVHCDCLAKRTLCCVLDQQQWDDVADGKIVTVPMYDSLEDLEMAQGKDRGPGQSPTTATSTVSRDTAACTSSSQAPTPHPPPPRLQMFAGGGPHGGPVEPTSDPFPWRGAPPQTTQSSYPPHSHTADAASRNGLQSMHTFQAMTTPPAENPRSVSQAQFGQFQISLPPAAHNQSGGANERYEPVFVAPPISSLMQIAGDGTSSPIDPQIMAIQHGMSSSHLDVVPPHTPYSRDMSHTIPLDHNTMMQSQVLSHGMGPSDANMWSPPASTVSSTTRPSQSCCSKRVKAEPSQNMQTFETFAYPGLPPMQQFPCASCASTLCTCANCPSTMQSFEFGGAWAQACGRTGHLESAFPTAYSFPEVHTPPATMAPPPPPPGSHRLISPPLSTAATSVVSSSSGCCTSRPGTHQPVDSFNPLGSQDPNPNSWPPPPLAYQQQQQVAHHPPPPPHHYPPPPPPITTGPGCHTVNPSLLHEDTIMWQ